MPIVADIMDASAALLNDAAQSRYTDAVQTPYFNIAMRDLQEEFELANVPITNKTSEIITLEAQKDRLGFGTTPALPGDLVEIQQLWERSEGVNPFIPMTKKEFIPHTFEDQQINQFLFWAWIENEIHLIKATANIDLRIDYISTIFKTIPADETTTERIDIKNTDSYLQYRTAGHCAMYVMENNERAQVLYGQAQQALDKSIGIATKGRQAIITRKRPFMAAYKRRGWF